MKRISEKDLVALRSSLKGELQWDNLSRMIYATDASIYREVPDAVAFPDSPADIIKLVEFAATHDCPLIPRAAGTSLAGQCVGNGIVVDVSKHMSEIMELNVEEKWVKVQPGVIRDQLNEFLKPHGLHFGPNTSTANRAMIGGMVGNNSSGSTSIVYGTTRDHTLEVNAILSDGSSALFKPLSKDEMTSKCRGTGLESDLYRMILKELDNEEVQQEILREFPLPSIHRRNTGYAIDELLKHEPFGELNNRFNFCSLLCGSEGTLAFSTEIKLSLNPLPPAFNALLCPHFEKLGTALEAVLIAMQHKLYACELMDKVILDCARRNKEQHARMSFVEGDPMAILMIELAADSKQELQMLIQSVQDNLIKNGKAASCSVLYGEQINDAWEVRKAGLGVLSNIPGDKKAIACIEDTAVALKDLPAYIKEFTAMMDSYGQTAVYYAHAGAGELHLRPMLDLKNAEDLVLFKSICKSSAELVKKYRGSLSGEHGDGRVRAAFVRMMVGDKNYALFERIKKTWDPLNILNPGKIVNAKAIDSDLRFDSKSIALEPDTLMDFSDTMGMLRAAEKCNGSGDCRKLSFSGGGMCPSYRATRDEKDTTRARANALREIIIHSTKENVFDSTELMEVMDLCVSCKACANECPSNVDIAVLKAEFLHQYYKKNGIPLRARLIANSASLNRMAGTMSGVSNLVMQSALFKKCLGLSTKRELPKLQNQTLRKWINAELLKSKEGSRSGSVVCLFIDEFSNYYDVEIGKKTFLLLHKLGYNVKVPLHSESGRAAISKGLLDRAKRIANSNVEVLSSIVNEEIPLIGIEPSAILTFRDEYPRLVSKALKEKSDRLAKNTFTIEEFLFREMERNNISRENFVDKEVEIYVHGHCHQKALSSMKKTLAVLAIPKNFKVKPIVSGCCGMAGSFGYEKEHYDVSMAMGELALFPSVRNASREAVIVAAGTSCRHQIFDGTGRTSKHPVEVLYDAVSY